MFYTITNRDGQQTLSVFGDSFEKVVPANHPNFETLVTYLVANTEHDEEHVRGLVDPTVGIGRVLKEHFGDRLTFDLHNLFLDGLPLSGSLASQVKNRLTSQDQDWERFARFLVNLDENPSKRAKDAVWRWVEANGLTITEDGCFLGYKGVLRDGTSKACGPDNFVNGVYYGKPGVAYQVPHEIGSVISKKRADVDDTPGGGCSVGLHVGTKSYATNWAPRLLTVKVNPRDVVSAPDGDLSYKIRVCSYEVVDLAKDEHFASTSADPVTEEQVKSAERIEKEATLVGLSAYQRERYDAFRKAGWEHGPSLEGAQAEPEEKPAPFRVVPVLSDSESLGEPLAEFETYAEAVEFIVTRDVVEAEVEVINAEGEVVAAEDDLDVVNEFVQQASDDIEDEEINANHPVVPVEEGKTLADYAEAIPALKDDLFDPRLGHKPLAAKWSVYTTESSVRRYRKAHGVSLTLLTKIKG